MRKTFPWLLGLLFFIACNSEQPAAETEKAATTETAAAPAAVEIASDSYMTRGKEALAKMTAGDVDGFLSNYADNAVFLWNNGDSLAGKAAILEYWKKRRTEVIDSITFSNDVWLPVKVNQPQQPTVAPGNWLLSWYMVDAKYKSGKHMRQYIHTVMHFNSEDKIDRVIQYRDQAVINAAMKK